MGLIPYGSHYLKDGNSDGIFNIYDPNDQVFDQDQNPLTTSRAVQNNPKLKSLLRIEGSSTTTLQLGFLPGPVAVPQTTSSPKIPGPVVGLGAVVLLGLWLGFRSEEEPVDEGAKVYVLEVRNEDAGSSDEGAGDDVDDIENIPTEDLLEELDARGGILDILEWGEPDDQEYVDAYRRWQEIKRVLTDRGHW